jgi:hypothetical protein
MFPWRQNNLYFDPETKYSIHFSQIDEQVPYWSHAAVIYGVELNDKNLSAILFELGYFLSKYSPLSESLIALGGGTWLKYPFITGRGK